MRKNILVVLLIISVSLLASLAEAQNEKLPKEEKTVSTPAAKPYMEPLSLLCHQVPLNKEDVEIYVKLIKEIEAIEDEPNKVEALLKEHNWNNLQYTYIDIRVGMAMAVLQNGETAKESLPMEIMPTKEELDLVRPYEEQLRKYFTVEHLLKEQ